MPGTRIWLWNKAPFIRLIVPLILGILLQWYVPFSSTALLLTALILVLFLLLFSSLALTQKYKLRTFYGVALHGLLIVAGAALVFINDVRHNKDWFGHFNKEGYTLVTLQEPVVEKTASYKALVSIDGVYIAGQFKALTGKAILYFKKDSISKDLDYGSRLLIAKPIGEVKNEGNPGGFDYKRYCLFQGITHQTNVGAADYVLLKDKKQKLFYRFLYNSRLAIIKIIRKYISATKEQGLAEALLIGFKDDLDKNLVQAYTNTGVVHIIAISGLHLGLIYWLLLLLTKPLNRKKLLVLRLLLILAGLWLFSLLAGGQPSILRSALMFSVIAVATVLDKRSSIFNTLALSAFILLCINPFWLWDVGFQLSYAAVLSIVLFFKPIHNWWRPENKLLDLFSNMIAVTLAAQLLTLPLSLYHFHQFPTLFIFTNLLAIPLSSIILFSEILLCCLFFIPPVATLLGKLIVWMLQMMNSYIEALNNVSFAVWDGISISLVQAFLLTAFIAGTAFWLMEKSRKGFWAATIFLLLFLALQAAYLLERKDQKKVIVYHVPRYQAIDLLDGTGYTFIGDKALEQDLFLRNFHLQPTRILYGANKATDETASHFVTFYTKKILVLDTTLHFSNALKKEPIDVLVLSYNPKIYINELLKRFDLRQIIIDGSVPPWKAKLWQRDCDSLHLPCYNVSEKGAFVMSLE